MHWCMELLMTQVFPEGKWIVRSRNESLFQITDFLHIVQVYKSLKMGANFEFCWPKQNCVLAVSKATALAQPYLQN